MNGITRRQRWHSAIHWLLASLQAGKLIKGYCACKSLPVLPILLLVRSRGHNRISVKSPNDVFHYFEADVLAAPRYPQAVKFVVGHFSQLFGTKEYTWHETKLMLTIVT